MPNPAIHLAVFVRNNRGRLHSGSGSLYYAHLIEGVTRLARYARTRASWKFMVYTRNFVNQERRGRRPTARVTVDTLWPARSRLYRCTSCNYDRIWWIDERTAAGRIADGIHILGYVRGRRLIRVTRYPRARDTMRLRRGDGNRETTPPLFVICDLNSAACISLANLARRYCATSGADLR